MHPARGQLGLLDDSRSKRWRHSSNLVRYVDGGGNRTAIVLGIRAYEKMVNQLPSGEGERMGRVYGVLTVRRNCRRGAQDCKSKRSRRLS